MAVDPGKHQPIGRAVAAAASCYVGVVFALAFLLGTVRVLWLAPRTGAVAAVLLETPIVLLVSWWAAGVCCRRFGLQRKVGACALMGALAFALLMLIEFAVATLLFGTPATAYVSAFRSVAGAVGLAAQLGFAAIPAIQARR